MRLAALYTRRATGNAFQQLMPPVDQAGTNGAFRGPANHQQPDQQSNQPETRNAHADGRVEKATEQAIDALEHPPEHEAGNRHGRDHDETGDQVAPARGAHEAFALQNASTCFRMVSWRCHISLPSRASCSG